ncbi:MAG: hypothetical protein JWN21_2036 [Sphingomonas bacterium]|uniref:DUF2827 family protein n=1 Tax=Sphingomonas bacterium TaxID=1895847 RepID=UPI0026277460|nr:DUF2827 family protein [Sphingomonas bacterium]MDB5696493.1 hypothetical protein [Sphingomonas bacterium]
MASLRVGITFSRSAEDIASLLWSSGINQNAVLAVMAFRRLPIVADTFVVDCSGLSAPHPLATWAGVPTLSPADAAERCDVVIEIGARAPVVDMERLRARGGKLVSYMAGNAMAMNLEALSSGLSHGEIPSLVPFDAVWITPQHWHMNRDLCRIMRSDKVTRCPHIWDPIFFDLFARTHALNPFYRREDAARPWRIAVMEPNINVLKTFHLPMLVAEEAYRARPELIDRVLLFNTLHLVGNPHFDDITTGLDLHKSGKMFAEGRFATPVILAEHADAVVVHQWENDLNYLYWDVLWSGHPLIHNSPSARDVGYYYTSFDPADGGRVLADALGRHRDRAGTARAEALDFLRRFSIDQPAVLAAHEALIEDLFA